MPRQDLPTTYWQTGHVDAIRLETIVKKKSMSGDVILGLILDPVYAVDIDSERDWQAAERALFEMEQPFVRPGKAPRELPAKIELLVLDFDGTLTDDRVWVDADGGETVAAHRGDGWGISQLKERGVPIHILSTETPSRGRRASPQTRGSGYARGNGQGFHIKGIAYKYGCGRRTRRVCWQRCERYTLLSIGGTRCGSGRRASGREARSRHNFDQAWWTRRRARDV